jgi:HEAT repeat protein
MMLESLEKIDWSALDHAYGKAGDVPGLLRGLLAEDEDTRREALYELCGTIWHQGTVYEASPFAVPFLLEMLRSPDTPDKAGIAMLLAELADGIAPLELYSDPEDEMSRLMRAALAQEGRDFDRELCQGRVWVRSTRAAVGLGLELLFPYLRHNEPAVREAVVRALSRFPERAQDTVPLLEQALRSEGEDYVRETLKSSLTELEGRR